MILSRSLARSFPRPAFARSRSLAQRVAALHKLPELPYPHNVNDRTPTNLVL